MKISVNVQGLAQVKGLLSGFSDRRLRAAGATMLTRVARELAGEWNGELFANIDRPTAATINSVGVSTATADQPAAEVFIKDRPVRPGAPAPADWLESQEVGGDRFTKKFEILLMGRGSMPKGHKVVPGPYAKLDAFGNISRGQITQVLTQLGMRDASFAPGYAQTISASDRKRASAARRMGRDYIAIVQRKGKLRPGVYQRSGRGLLPVFFFVSTVHYRKRIDLLGVAKRDAPAILQRQGDRAINEHIARLQARGR